MRYDYPQHGGEIRLGDMAAGDPVLDDVPSLSPQEVAACIGISYHAVLRAVHRGDLVAYKICGRVKIRRSDLIAWIDAARVELEQQAQAVPDAPAKGSKAWLQSLEGDR